ncbi:MAG: hypothetical protein GY791_08865 [Alphaproteobacteria bacterium]|nr:hypothetical protein [Alphaproteobacteria bacterium]
MSGMRDAVGYWMARTDRTGYTVWFALSLAVAAVGGGVAMTEAFSAPFVIQDDARQHVVWALRFSDPELFPIDPIADYFRSVAPVGYTWVYRAAAAAGFDSIVVSKVLPMVLGLVFAGYGFGLGCRLIPVPAAGFLISWTLSQNAWLMDNLSSATPRAFLYPIFAAFLFYFLKKSGWGVAVTVLLLGLFYPQMALIAAGLAAFALIDFRRGVPRLTRDLSKGRVAAFGVAAAVVVLAPYALQSAVYGPVISAAAARDLPEFWVGGRAEFFDPDRWRFWTCGLRAGLFPIEWCQLKDRQLLGVSATVAPILVFLIVLALPLYLRASGSGQVAQRIGTDIYVLPRLVLVSLILFAAAHIVLFQLHLPNRYTQHSLRIAFDIAFGACVYLLLLKSVDWARGRQWMERCLGGLAIAATIAVILTMPYVAMKMGQRLYITGRHHALYEFLSQTEKGTTVASLEAAVDNVPPFASRAILFGPEYGIPYHLGYYSSLREKGRRIAETQYAANPALLRRFFRDYPVDYWLIDQGAFDIAQLESAWWAEQFPRAHQAAMRRTAAGSAPIMAVLAPLCLAARDGTMLLVDATCMREQVRR